MPEGYYHKWWCEQWKIPCAFRTCPLDERSKKDTHGRNWHSRHHEGVADYMQIDHPPTIGGCERWVKAVLERMEPDFAEFRSQLQGMSDDEARLCWTAHLLADYVSDYWHVGTGQKEKFKYLSKHDRGCYEQFMADVAKALADYLGWELG